MPTPVAFVIGIAMVAISIKCWSTREAHRDRFYLWTMGPTVDPASRWGRIHWYWYVWGTILFFGVFGTLTVVACVVRFARWAT